LDLGERRKANYPFEGASPVPPAFTARLHLRIQGVSQLPNPIGSLSDELYTI